jgi:hypothetical protein
VLDSISAGLDNSPEACSPRKRQSFQDLCAMLYEGQPESRLHWDDEAIAMGCGPQLAPVECEHVTLKISF